MVTERVVARPTVRKPSHPAARRRPPGLASTAAPATEASVRAALAEIPDPEIPVVSIVDLGMVERVRVEATRIEVELLPTFVGCPALEVIRTAVQQRLAAFDQPAEVRFGFRVPWTSDRITSAGRDRLRRHGFAPPIGSGGSALVSLEVPVACPHCGSRRTILENLFGPTQCRAIRYCTRCRQPFEQFKPV